MEVIKVKNLEGAEFVVGSDVYGKFDIRGLCERAGGSCFVELVDMSVEEFKAARRAAGDQVMSGRGCPSCIGTETVVLTADTELCEGCGVRWSSTVTMRL